MSWLREFLLFRSERALSFLLVFLILLLFVIYPFFSPTGLGKYLFAITFMAVHVSGAFAVQQPSLRRFALGLAAASLVTRWATYVTPNRDLLLGNTVLGIVFMTLAAVAILGRVFAEGPVTRHRVQGAVAVYLLVGVVFGSVFAFIAMTVPGAFALPDLPGEWTRENYDAVMGTFSYFSFITLTTVGYGDVTPLSAVAKQFAVLEGLIGQLYPAILLARLVSLQVTSRSD